MTFDLVLAGGRVIDPGQGINNVIDVAFKDGQVAALGTELKDNAKEVLDVSNKLVTPGLIDIHTHVYWGGTSIGVSPDAYCLRSGVTTAVDTGSAGPGNFAGFRAHVIEQAKARICAFLHISFSGIFAFSGTVMVGESKEIDLLAPADCVRVANDNKDIVVGIKVRCGRRASGSQGWNALQMALEVAEQTDLPLMAHIDHPPPTYDEIVGALRPGDILTHAFRPFPNTPVRTDGTVKDSVRAARERGVIFDIGHGKRSFSFETARPMLNAEFLPDTISSDVHTQCIDGPAYDLTTTMSKFLCLGMPLEDVVRATTFAPATAMRRPDLATLSVGSIGDATVLSLSEGLFAFEDTVGEVLKGSERLTAEFVVIGGQLA
jgi:dihydroorotase